MTAWFRQHRDSLLFRMPWHLEEPMPKRLALLGMRQAICATTMSGEDRGFDTMEDPPVDDPLRVVSGAMGPRRVRLTGASVFAGFR